MTQTRGAFMGATHHLDGRELSADERAASPLLGVVEVPDSYELRGHSGRVCRFRGWVVSTRGHPTEVRVRVGRRNGPVVPAQLPRPDVVDTLAPSGHELDLHCGFDFYVDLPRGLRRPLPVGLTLTDGELRPPVQGYAVLPGRHDVPLDTYISDSPAKRALAERYLGGRGVEFGALHQPLRVGPLVEEVRYVDRLSRSDSLVTFPELLGAYADAIVEPDFLIDLDTADLWTLEREQFDFFIANDVIEHLANPLRFLRHVHDVMKPGSRLFLSAPDRDYTFDSSRRLTRNRHLRREYRRDVRVVDDRHIRSSLRGEGEAIPGDRRGRTALYDRHRARSVHAHVWNQRSFDRFLAYARRHLDLNFTLVDHATSREALGCMVYVFERESAPGPGFRPHA